MPRGTQLSHDEKCVIGALQKNGVSNRKIAKQINRSHYVVNSYLKLGERYGSIKRTGRKPIVSSRDKRTIFRLATENHMFASQIRAELQLDVTTRRVRQILQSNKNLKWRKRLSKPKLTVKHIEARLAFAKRHMTWDHEWERVVFSDEKKFNLDGPDGWQCYWHDLRKSTEVSMSRNFGGGTVMVWGAFCFHGQFPIAWITTTMNSAAYVELLETQLIDNPPEFLEENFLFQQDNAAIHASKFTKQWFAQHNIELLEWPACSPDLNPIENLWGIISRRIYQNGKQFATINELKNTIREVWVNIELDEMQNLVKSMQNRVFELIRLNGKHTHY